VLAISAAERAALVTDLAPEAVGIGPVEPAAVVAALVAALGDTEPA
jgi:hypothetical protein